MNEEARRQVVPLVWYEGNIRHVIGEVVVIGDRFEAKINPDLPLEIRDLVTPDRVTSLSAHSVFDRATPIFPANAYEVNEPLAEQRLIDAILNIQSFKITEGETDG